MVHRMLLNEMSYFGWGSREVLVDEIKKRNYKRILVVTDSTLLEVGITNKVTSLLDEAEIDYQVFSEIKPNPTISNVTKGLKMVRKYHSDCLIAVGGGSVMDVAKAIGIVTTNPEYKDIKSLVGTVNTKKASLPIIALPTTAGSASETTINYVITDEEKKIKMVCVDPHVMPTLAIIDDELMIGMPALTTAATGLDALTHAIECYLTKDAWEMTDMFALKAIELIHDNLESAVAKNQEAMGKMALAQYIAGMGFSNAGLGIIHSMAHQLGAMYDTPHGVANALLLPYVLEFNGKENPKKFRDIAYAFHLNVESLKDSDVIGKVVEEVKKMNRKLNIPSHIRDIGGKEADIHLLAQKALADPCTGGSLRNVTVNDFVELYKKAL